MVPILNTMKEKNKPGKNQSNDTSTNAKGLKFTRYFTEDTVSPFDQFAYEKRSSVIRNPQGDAVFEMQNVEVPGSAADTGIRRFR